MITNEAIDTKKIPFPIKKADSFSSRLRGLMFRKEPLHNEGLWIIPCNSIHMCFMHFPIDVVFLDKQERIVHLVRSIQPWRMIAPIKGAHSVVELPVGTIDQLELKIGYQLDPSL
ncbi:DUF192 domain-containing protein [Neobacillus sp. LXY-4]|uniref:DUF192 domain-containing protein n=1 Tax=Neobacillus sp. LXY-4 TaxID=3379826 RepID=UPI003EE2877F